MSDKATIELSFSIDGRKPSQDELDAILTQIIEQWPIWVFHWGDDSTDDDGVAILEQISARWGAAP